MHTWRSSRQWRPVAITRSSRPWRRSSPTACTRSPKAATRAIRPCARTCSSARRRWHRAATCPASNPAMVMPPCASSPVAGSTVASRRRRSSGRPSTRPRRARPAGRGWWPWRASPASARPRWCWPRSAACWPSAATSPRPSSTSTARTDPTGRCCICCSSARRRCCRCPLNINRAGAIACGSAWARMPRCSRRRCRRWRHC